MPPSAPPRPPVRVERRGRVTVVTLDRPHVRNAVDGPTAAALAQAFRRFDADDAADVAVLHGAGGTFCAGADLKAIAEDPHRANRVEPPPADAPMGVSRLQLSKPTIAAIEGHAVAGGLELALWCDLRVAARSAVIGVFCRRWGVPLVDLGTVRLPRLVGQGRALDLVLTGRPVGSDEALRIGLVDRVVEDGTALDAAMRLAEEIATFPQGCLRADRRMVLEQWDLPRDEALAREHAGGVQVLGDAVRGAARFAGRAGRHGSFEG